VVAVINSVGASAAYLIALHTDKIVAGKYSLVGGVGAMMASWDLSKAIGRVDVSQRVYTSGKLKSFMNPFSPISHEAEAKARQIVNQMGEAFLKELNSSRGKVLKTGFDYSTGEIWGGSEAIDLGLIDAIGTLDEVVRSTWDLKIYDFGPNREGLSLMSASANVAVRSIVQHWLTHQSLQLR
jgi:protease IV